LLGGDTVGGSGPQSMGLTAIGAATVVPVPDRAGAKPGDQLWVTGTLGGAMVGLEALRSGTGDSAAYRRPEARLAEGITLAPLVSAMMDISDGLLLDATRMAQASGVTIAIAADLVPLAVPQARRNEAMRWGDDYELLFTAPADATIPVPATRIGEVLPLQDVPLLVDGAPLAPEENAGFEHN